jgi:hypothetical protein
MRSLTNINRISLKLLGKFTANCLFANILGALVLIDISGVQATEIVAPFSEPIAQSISTQIPSCPEITNRRYVVLTDRPVNSLPQLPQFLAIAATPCSYINPAMTFFGSFDNTSTAIFRVSQLRELGIDAIVHSFSTNSSAIPPNIRAAAILVESGNDQNMTLQQVRSLTGKTAFLAAFNNRSVILAAPLSSQQNATAIANLLRNQGLAAQVISADLIAAPNPPTSSLGSTLVPTSTPNQNSGGSAKIIYRILIPNANTNTLKQARELAPDAFLTVFKSKSYIQLRTYTNRANAHRERDRLNTRFPGTILLQD